MTTELRSAPPVPSSAPTPVFDRVVAFVERADERLGAARLGLRAVRSGGELTLAVHAGWLLPFEDEELRREADATFARVRALADGFGGAHTSRLVGRPADVALEELERRDATLAVVELREHRRALGIVTGALATVLLHDAPCSVLVTQADAVPPGWPRSIAVGVDGSVESAAALCAAWELASRTGARVRAFAATEDDHADLELVRRVAPDFEPVADHPVSLLVGASDHADLVVVGSRGLRGLGALGSVSERVAHHARCPVLVVRDHPRAKGAER